MRLIRFAIGGIVGLTLCVAVANAAPPATKSTPPPADASRSPLRILPEQTDLLVAIKQPRRLVETLTALEMFQQIQQIAPVRELFDSTPYRRFYQLIAYFEKELGDSWPRLLERLAGRGAALGIVFQSFHKDNKQFGINPTALLLAVEGTDEKLMEKFFRLSLKVFEQELARQEMKVKPIKSIYAGVETFRFGDDIHAAVARGALLVSNTAAMLHAGIDRRLGKVKASLASVAGVEESAKLLPTDPLFSVWFNVETARTAPGNEAFFKATPPRDDPGQTISLGHFLDLLSRSPFVCGGVCAKKDGFLATVRLPRGREGMGLDQLIHVPPRGKDRWRPPLEPKNVIFSQTEFFDIARIWTDRDRLFSEQQAKALEQAEKQSAPFLLGGKFSRLMTLAGPHYRFVAVHQTKTGYKTTPKYSIPAFALAWELNQSQTFMKAVEPILRGAALLGGAQADLKLVEEEYKGHKLIGYRFPEDKKSKGGGDDNYLRYNFSPCFTRVGDQFLACSTIELCRELVELIGKEKKTLDPSKAVLPHSRIYASGAVAYLKTLEDFIATRATLDQAVTPQEAREQVKLLLDMVRRLGVLTYGVEFKEKTTEYNIRLRAAR